MPFDMRPLFQSLIAVWTIVQQLTTFFSGDFLAFVDDDLVTGAFGLPVIIAIFFCAGISETFGTRAVTLFLNKVGRAPFLIALLLTALTYVFGGFIWAFSSAYFIEFFFDHERAFTVMARAIAIGYIPLLFAFLAFIPYLGPAILVFLQALSLALVTFMIAYIYQLPLLTAAFCMIGGWLVFQLLRWFTSGPTTVISRWVMRRITGREVHYRLQDIVPQAPTGLRKRS
jgi:hypothetical protein